MSEEVPLKTVQMLRHQVNLAAMPRVEEVFVGCLVCFMRRLRTVRRFSMFGSSWYFVDCNLLLLGVGDSRLGP